MARKVERRAELALIEQVAARFGRRPTSAVPLGIGDDCAIVRPRAGEEVLVTTDFSLEGRHFRRDTHPAQAVGHRTLARGLSDLAAMGAKPLAAFLSLALPAEMPGTAAGRRWIAGFLDGMHVLATKARVPLAGGDTAQAPGKEILADIVLLGTAPAGSALRRSGARAGDLLYVTGALGGAAAELRGLLAGGRVRRGAAVNPHLYPQPRLGVGRTLRRRGMATAAIDLSDGLSTDLTHLCEASGLRAEIEADAIPLHALAKGELGLALHGGEDYELLFAARPGTRVPKKLDGVGIHCVGRMLKPKVGVARILLVGPDGMAEALAPGGWEHFAG